MYTCVNAPFQSAFVFNFDSFCHSCNIHRQIQSRIRTHILSTLRTRRVNMRTRSGKTSKIESERVTNVRTNNSSKKAFFENKTVSTAKNLKEKCKKIEEKDEKKTILNQSVSPRVENIILTRSKSEKIPIIRFNSPSFSIDQEKKQKKSTVATISFVKSLNFNVNSIVLAKQKNSFPWPSRVLTIEKKRVLVYFFGDRRSGYVKSSEIYDFIKSHNAVSNKLESKYTPKAFKTGVAEIKLLLNIPRN